MFESPLPTVPLKMNCVLWPNNSFANCFAQNIPSPKAHPNTWCYQF